MIASPKKHSLCETLLNHYLTKGHISRSESLKYQAKNPDVAADIENIIKYVERDLLLKHILNMGLDIDIEVYGYGWDQDSDFHAFHKGELSYGEEVSKEYNRATYALVIGGYVLQQRTLEAAASGAIPLVLEPQEQSSIKRRRNTKTALSSSRNRAKSGGSWRITPRRTLRMLSLITVSKNLQKKWSPTWRKQHVEAQSSMSATIWISEHAEKFRCY